MNLISHFRKKKNLKQDDLANLLDITPKSLGLYEAGKVFPRLDIAVKISEILDVPICYLWPKLICKCNKK